jgi:hypothetical protein
MKGLLTTRYSVFATIFVALGLLAGPSPAYAGDVPPDFRTDFRGYWDEWANLERGVNGTPLTARMDALSSCLVPDDPTGVKGLGATGDEFNFSFQLIGDNCYSGNGIESRPIAVFYWQYFDGENSPVTFPCLDVRGSVSSEDILVARIVFEPDVTFGVASENATRSQLTNITELEFALEIPYLDAGQMAALGSIGPDDFLIRIWIDECNQGWDGPDIDIEHYRQRAAEMTSLPDTV